MGDLDLGDVGVLGREGWRVGGGRRWDLWVICRVSRKILNKEK